MGDLREPNVIVSPPSTSPSPWIGPERWVRAEKETQKIIFQVQPTSVSEERRREVIDYVQRLIKARLGCEVFAYGSVPLKTYLPDGDIDLTAFGGASVEDALANDMVSVLEGEDQNRAAEFVVKDVQLVRAEVKLVKCIVQNIVVDVSFNQIGGICTLCFLEQVDRLIGKNHLFKRSIILIKAWCYYESRILGAHHGLISTYALETLVLYIFHMFHSTLNGPFAVLYKFLDYFSKFDWDNYCISLTGPFRISSLPEIVAETPENGGNDLLISKDFLRYCWDMFSVPSKGVEINSRTFPLKHLNIVDPLKENNNLGRSVSKGNFYRIRSAFSYGARKLGRILVQLEDSMADELRNFFSNTLDRHGNGRRPDVQEAVSISSCIGVDSAFPVSETESCLEQKVISELKYANCIGPAGDCKPNPYGSPQDRVNNIIVSGTESQLSSNATMMSEADGSAKGNALLGFRFAGDAKDLATSRIQALKISNDSTEIYPQSGERSVSPQGMAYHAPHLYFSNTISCNGKMKYGNLDTKQLGNNENNSSGIFQALDEEQGVINHCGQLGGNDEVRTPVRSKDVPLAPNPVACREGTHPVNCDQASASSAGSPEPLNSLSDLSGDYDSHLNSLKYGWWYYENASSVLALPMPPPPPSHFQSMNSWDAVQHLPHFKRNGLSHGSVNGVIPSPVFYPMNPIVIPGVAFGLEEMPKPRGTGTYIPNMTRPPQDYRLPTVKGRNQAPARSPRNNGRALAFTEFAVDQGRGTQTPRNNGRAPAFTEFTVDQGGGTQVPRNNGRAPAFTEFAVDQGGGTPRSSDIHQSGSPHKKVYSNVNGVIPPSERVEFGPVGHIPVGAPLLDGSTKPRPASSLPKTSSQELPALEMQKPKSVSGMDQDRFMTKSSYHLKDDEDFPPLSV